MSGDVLYDYDGMAACLEDVNRCIQHVEEAKNDINQVIVSLEEVYKTKAVSEAQTAAYRQQLQQIQEQVVEPLMQQRDYVQRCMDEANESDHGLARGWG